MFKKINCITLIFCGSLINFNCFALDMEVLKEQCADIGFKINTPDNGKCVIRLMKSVANQKAKEEAEQRAYQNQQAAKAQEIRQAEAIRQQQSEMLELQRRSIEAQENIASEQRRSAGLQLMQKGLESLSGANRPAPVPILRTPIECRTYGNRTTCD